MAATDPFVAFARLHGLRARTLSETFVAGGFSLEIRLSGDAFPTGHELGIPLDFVQEARPHFGIGDILLAIQSLCHVAEIPYEELPVASRIDRRAHGALLEARRRVAEIMGPAVFDEFVTSVGPVEGWSLGRDDGTRRTD